MNKKEISIVELFSGIGSQAKALFSVTSKRDYKMISLNTCEWDIHSIIAYDYIHNGTLINQNVINLNRDTLLERLSYYNLSNNGKDKISKNFLYSLDTEILRKILSSILNTKNLVNVEDIKTGDLPVDIDVLTYSFPCQDLSNVGALHGYNKGIERNSGSRSSLLWRVGKILNDRISNSIPLPKFLLLENVTALEAERHSKNFKEWQSILEGMGYINRVYKLNASDFGVPQNRKRLLMISVLSNNKKVIEDYFVGHDLNNKEYINSLNLQKYELDNILRLNMDDSIFFNEAKLSQPNQTESRKTIWNQNSKIIDENGFHKKIVQTITTKQDRHPNSGNIYFDYVGNEKTKYRFLTPRECFMLMGFDENDYDILINNNFMVRGNSLFFSRDRMYRLAGNSIVVNILEQVFNQIIDLKEILNSN